MFHHKFSIGYAEVDTHVVHLARFGPIRALYHDAATADSVGEMFELRRSFLYIVL